MSSLPAWQQNQPRFFQHLANQQRHCGFSFQEPESILVIQNTSISWSKHLWQYQPYSRLLNPNTFVQFSSTTRCCCLPFIYFSQTLKRRRKYKKQTLMVYQSFPRIFFVIISYTSPEGFSLPPLILREEEIRSQHIYSLTWIQAKTVSMYDFPMAARNPFWGTGFQRHFELWEREVGKSCVEICIYPLAGNHTRCSQRILMLSWPFWPLDDMELDNDCDLSHRCEQLATTFALNVLLHSS